MSQAKRKVVMVGDEAQKEVFAGAYSVADGVKRTLGPYGRNFASAIRGGPIEISNDGVSLAKYMVGTGKNEFQDIGISAFVEAATKTNDIAGDGTSTAVVVAEATLRLFETDSELMKKKSSPVALMRTINEEVKLVVTALEGMAEKIDTREKLIEVARVSVEDPTLAELIGGAQWDVTEFGTVLAEEHNDVETVVEKINGIKFDNGFGTSRIINNQEKQQLELKDMHIIVTNHVINSSKTLSNLKLLFDQLIDVKETKGVIIIARAFDETAIGLCVKNLQNGFPIYPINAPYTDQDEIMSDLAAALGATYIKSGERSMSNVVIGDVGFASHFIARRFEAIVVGKPKDTDPAIDAAVEKRIADIKSKLEGQVSPFEKRNLEARLAQLTCGTALVKVGAETEQERKYKKAKVDDAVNAVKAAIQFGVVPGAGQALMIVADNLPEGSLLIPALRAPYLQIQKLSPDGKFGIESWVRDPLKVVKTAVQKAVSIASSLGTMEVAINHEREKPMWVKQAEQNMAPDDEE